MCEAYLSGKHPSSTAYLPLYYDEYACKEEQLQRHPLTGLLYLKQWLSVCVEET